MNRQQVISRLVARNTQPSANNKAFCINAANKALCFPAKQKAICVNAVKPICFGAAQN